VRLKALRSPPDRPFFRPALDAATEGNKSVVNMIAGERQAAEDGVDDDHNNGGDDNDNNNGGVDDDGGSDFGGGGGIRVRRSTTVRVERK
jgi:hypothetical protein